MKSDYPSLRLAIDIDGVLADFTSGYSRILTELNDGKCLFDPKNDPPCWHWPEAVGYTKEQDQEAWKVIGKDRFFWATLKPYEELRLTPVMETFLSLLVGGHEIYFMTNRVGPEVHTQTVTWLVTNGVSIPTVLIAGEQVNAEGEKESVKGVLCKALNIDHFLDDKPENCFAVAKHSPTTKVYLLRRRYNDTQDYITKCFSLGITILPNIRAFFEILVKELPIALTR